MIYFYRQGYIYGVPTDEIEKEHPGLKDYPMPILDLYDMRDPHYNTRISQDFGSNFRMGRTFWHHVNPGDILEMDPKAFILAKSWLDVEEWEARNDPDALEYCQRIREAIRESEEGAQ